MGDNYVRVKATLVDRRENAILIDLAPQDEPTKERWIPRSLIHGADDIRLENTPFHNTIIFRLMEWKAKEISR